MATTKVKISPLSFITKTAVGGIINATVSSAASTLDQNIVEDRTIEDTVINKTINISTIIPVTSYNIHIRKILSISAANNNNIINRIISIGQTNNNSNLQQNINTSIESIDNDIITTNVKQISIGRRSISMNLRYSKCRNRSNSSIGNRYICSSINSKVKY
jgi:hypothetical protein